jgi:hypothetical protein
MGGWGGGGDGPQPPPPRCAYGLRGIDLGKEIDRRMSHPCRRGCRGEIVNR